MSIIIQYEHGQLIRAEMPTARSTPSPTFACSNGKTFAVGDIWGTTFDDISQMDWTHEPNLLNNIEGAKAIVHADIDSCVFAVDMNGIDTFYYYCRNGRFILSDNFWIIVRVVQPEYEDLNIEEIKKSLITASTVGDCPIIGMKYLLPNHIGVYNVAKQSCEVRQYGEYFHYASEISTVNEAVANMDKCLHHAMECIKEKCGEGPYGLGLSGGLDSRVIPYYALQHGLKLNAFNTCVSHPHGIFKARSIKSAEELARYYNIPFQLNEWDKSTLSKKFSLCLQQFPIDSGGSPFKYEYIAHDHFSSMINGGSGMIVGGGGLPEGIEQMTEGELLSAMKEGFFPSSITSFRARAVRAISYIVGVPIRSGFQTSLPYSSIMDKNVWESAEHEMRQYISNRKMVGLSNADIFEDYFINVVGFLNRFGAHESLLGQKRAFSIYIPFMLKETLRWDPSLLKNRIVLNTLIRDKISECASIKEESFMASINKNPSFLQRFSSTVGFLLRGNGTAIDQYYMPQRDVMRKYLHYINKESGTWFRRVFNLERPITMREAKRESPRANIRIWQIAMLLCCLETKQYMEWDNF